MEVHVIVSILLDYYCTIQNWSKSRCLNKHIKHIIDTKKYDKEAFGRRTFIKITQCSICEKNAQEQELDMLNYNQFEKVCHIVHCRHWHCRMSAVYSMLGHCASINMYILRQPFQKSNSVGIPRTDGSITQGKCVNNAVVKRNDEYYVYTYWYDEKGDNYTKLIPLKHYTDVSARVY